MEKQEILNIIKNRKTALSAKGIAEITNTDADSSELRNIEQSCWEMEEDGILIAYDRREENQGLFFGQKA